MARGWMPLYVADYLADTGHLSTVEHGAYLLLIMHYWQNAGLPDDDKKLSRIVRMTADEWADVRETLADLFSEGWVHGRINAELARPRRQWPFGRPEQIDDGRIHGTAWRNLRKAVFHCDDYPCQYCGQRGGRLECDHIVPVAKGGQHGLDNLATACFACNRSKRDKTLDEWVSSWL